MSVQVKQSEKVQKTPVEIALECVVNAENSYEFVVDYARRYLRDAVKRARDLASALELRERWVREEYESQKLDPAKDDATSIVNYLRSAVADIDSGVQGTQALIGSIADVARAQQRLFDARKQLEQVRKIDELQTMVNALTIDCDELTRRLLADEKMEQM